MFSHHQHFNCSFRLNLAALTSLPSLRMIPKQSQLVWLIHRPLQNKWQLQVLFQVRYATCSFNLAPSTTAPLKSIFSPSRLAWPTVVHKLQPQHLPVQDACVEIILCQRIKHLLQLYNLGKHALFLLTSNHRNPDHLNNNISLFRLPSRKNVIFRYFLNL